VYVPSRGAKPAIPQYGDQRPGDSYQFVSVVGGVVVGGGGVVVGGGTVVGGGVVVGGGAVVGGGGVGGGIVGAAAAFQRVPSQVNQFPVAESWA
jgi:acetyltransferase-like isoleucine patch superfamily enzyme